ncbi:MAG: response regulator [Gammaproteobacteria bacterium]|nr:MAG: response regulator [Gammaproteobacteria bacterium]
MDGNQKVLVMDDDEMILTLVTSILELHDFLVETATDGQVAIEKYQRAMAEGQPFDLVIMDLTIPTGMGGKEALIEILKIDPAAKCVVSSGHSSDPIMTKFSDYGFKGVITKPFMVAELVGALKDIIDN